MSRALSRFVPQLRAALPTPRAASVLPSLALSRSFNSTTPIIDPITKIHEKNASNPTSSQPRPLAFKKSHPAPPPEPIDDAMFADALTLLAAQPGHYITVHIHGFPYLVQEGDQIRLPFKMPGVVPGDVLRLNRASVLGSRDYTVKGAPHIDDKHFECRATVLGTESEPMRIKIKKKRRQRRMRQAKSKHQYTILRISDLTINAPEIEMS